MRRQRAENIVEALAGRLGEQFRGRAAGRLAEGGVRELVTGQPLEYLGVERLCEELNALERRFDLPLVGPGQRRVEQPVAPLLRETAELL